jgi:hypothetical protein
MTRPERTQFLRRARELAASGRYSGYQPIVHPLRREGYAKARQWLEDDLVCSELDQICAETGTAIGMMTNYRQNEILSRCGAK